MKWILLLIILPCVLAVSLEYKTLTSESAANTVFSTSRYYLDVFDILNLNSSTTNIKTVYNREELNFLNQTIIYSGVTLVRTYFKRYFTILNYKSNQMNSTSIGFQTSNVTRLIKRVELRRMYQGFVNEFNLSHSQVSFGKTEFDEVLYKKFNSGYKNGTIYYNDKPLIKPYEALIFSYSDAHWQKHIIIQGVSVEGELAALREVLSNKDNYEYRDHLVYINGSDNVETFDFIHKDEEHFNYYKKEYLNVIKKSMFGKFDEIDYSVIIDNVSLRFKHLKTLVPDKVKVRNNITSNPIVFAGGLWSDINTWRNLASEMSDRGRNVWMIEITGGPGQDCDTCPNYDFDDLINSYWPALIGAIQTLNNDSEIYYVGHSNGARTGICSLEVYNNIGKNNSGIMTIDNETINVSMTKHPVNKYVAVGVPGSFEGQGVNPVFTLIKTTGNNTIDFLSNNNESHITILQILASVGHQKIATSSSTISLNLWKNYYNWVKQKNDSQIGNVEIDNFLIIKGNACITSDCIVTTKDEDEIFEKINSSNKIMKEIFAIHRGMGDNEKIQTFITEFIK